MSINILIGYHSALIFIYLKKICNFIYIKASRNTWLYHGTTIVVFVKTYNQHILWVPALSQIPRWCVQCYSKPCSFCKWFLLLCGTQFSLRLLLKMFLGSWFLIPPPRQRRPQTLSGSPSSKLPAEGRGTLDQCPADWRALRCRFTVYVSHTGATAHLESTRARGRERERGWVREGDLRWK